MTERGRTYPTDDEPSPSTALTRARSAAVAISIFGRTMLLLTGGVSRRRTLGVVGAALAGAFGGTAAAGGDDGAAGSEDESAGTAGDEPPERYVVGLEAGTSTANVVEDEATLYRSLQFESAGSVLVGEFDEDARQDLETRSDVRYVERDHVRRPMVRSSTESADAVDLADEQKSPWGVERIGATAFHGSNEGDGGASVAVLDSGVDPEHESLEVSDGEAFAECGGASCAAEWDDETGHGTHCAGTIGALDNGTGVVGAVPGADICALKVLAGDGSGYDSDIAAAIEWCADNDIDVINLSLGGSDEAQVLEDALAYAYERGVLIVAAAGNDGSVGGVDYPAGYDECIAVGATDDRDEVPDWSARGDGIELVAPGEDVLSTKPDDEYVSLSGTSMSTPHVAAIGAQLMSRGLPHVENVDDVDDPGGARAVLRETAEDVGFDEDEQGYGLLNAFDAFEQLEPVSTEDVTDVRATTATLVGSFRSLADDASEASFRWRESDGSEWTETDPESVEPGDEFSTSIDGLSPDTEYDVRAVLDDGDEPAAANVVTFETGLADLAVETDEGESVDHRTIRAVGGLRGLGDAETVEVACDVRPNGDDEWERTEPETLASIGSFETEVNGLEPETEYEIRAVAAAESNGETATGDTATVETEPEPGLPSIDRFEPTDDSSSQFVRCNVNWTVSDRDEALEFVATELRYAGDDEVIHRIASEIDGGEESGIHTVRNSDRFDGAGEEYDVTLTVTDAEGNVTEETDRLTLDERSPAPSIDRFEIETDDFLGTPEAVVEWAVSDEGGELDEVELELRPADGSDAVDTANSMARDDEATGEDSLRAADDAEAAYDVTILATDYFEQTTEETKRITLGE
ncbi:S8 family serine peptidase [Natrialbaceae archaeon A-arb3/5]